MRRQHGSGRRAAVGVVFACALNLLWTPGCTSRDSGPAPTRKTIATVRGGTPAAEYVGSNTCAQCHAAQHQRWTNSHHDLAMQRPGKRSVLGDFDDAIFRDGLEKTIFRKDENAFIVNTKSASGKRADFVVRYTFGVYPLQQYLVETAPGRLQAFPIAWDARPEKEGGQRWFHLQPGANLSYGDRFHWSGPDFNWNSSCASCHSTAVRKNYVVESKRYETRFEEIDVGCESCHGPMSNHVRQPMLDNAKRPDEQLETCAPCHSRRLELGGHPSRFENSYQLELLTNGLYFADGQADDEVFVLGSFLQSKMYAAGVVCSDCHDPHSLHLKREGNALCNGCHEVNPYNTKEHSLHDVGWNVQCTDCHMPERTYMQVDERADHRFGIPRPALSQRIGSPDACTNCHSNKSAKWAQTAIDRAYGKQDAHPFAEELARARKIDASVAASLESIARSEATPAVVVATAARELSKLNAPSSPVLAKTLARNPDVLARLEAITLAQAVGTPGNIELLRSMLDDPAKPVRIAAASAVLNTDKTRWTAASQRSFVEAKRELMANAEFNADRPGGLLTLARLAISDGRNEAAIGFLQDALSLDRAYTAAHINLSDCYRVVGRERDALRVLRDALALADDQATIEHAIGLTLVRLEQHEKALKHLGRAYQSRPETARFGYVYAVALHDCGKRQRALQVLSDVNDRHPFDRHVLAALIAYSGELGLHERTRKYRDALQKVSAQLPGTAP